MRKLALAAATAALALAALPSAANATDVCNEAENSWTGRLRHDRDPRQAPARVPARRADARSAKNGKGKGLVHAAERSPSKEVCGGDGGDGGDGGGADHRSCETIPPMSAAALRLLRPGRGGRGQSRLSERAFEACARADVEVFALAGDEDEVESTASATTSPAKTARSRS